MYEACARAWGFPSAYPVPVAHPSPDAPRRGRADGFQQDGLANADLETHPDNEQGVSGIYRVKAVPAFYALAAAEPEEPELMTAALRRPNGLAFAPDGRFAYITSRSHAELQRVPVTAAGDLLVEQGEPFGPRAADFAGPGSLDGVAVCPETGVVFVAAPGGVYVVSPDGVPLGHVHTGRKTGNVLLGADGSLYIAADSVVLRLPLRPRAEWLAAGSCA